MSPSGLNNAADYCQAARQSLQQGMVDNAIGLLNEALARDPNSYEAYSLLGVAYAQKGMVNEGIQALNTAVQLNPSNATARMNLAAALQRAGRLHDAISHLNEALRIDPNYQKARDSLATIQAQLQQQATSPAYPTAPAYAAPSAPVTPKPSVLGSWEQATGTGVPCPSCKANNKPDTQYCWQCGQPMKGGAPRPATVGAPAYSSAKASGGASGKAIASLIFGILGLVLCGCISGIVAVILGNQELKAIDSGRSSSAGRGLAKAGMIMLNVYHF